jgi:1-acyl-sn-glycerol-3-phosphate acyltransferase
MAAPPLPSADLLPVQRQATLAFRVARAVVGPLFRLVFRIRVEGRQKVPRDRPYIAIANHLNWPDPWLLLLTLPVEPRVHFLANPEAAYGPTEGQLQATFKKGFAHFAVRSGTPVVPVAISGTKDLWLGKTIRIRIGEPIEIAGRNSDSVHEQARQRLQELLPEYVEPSGPKPLRRFLTRLLY